MKFLLYVVSALTLGAAAGVSGAANLDAAAAQAQAQRLAVGVCGTCHGARGNSEQPKFPRLAGQESECRSRRIRVVQTRGGAG